MENLIQAPENLKRIAKVDWKSVPAEAKTVEIEINAPGTEIINRQ